VSIYAGNFEKAISDFQSSIRVKNENKEDGNDGGGDNMSNSSSQTDLSDVGLCSLNVHEATFNQVICYMLMGKWDHALTKVNHIMNDAPKKYTKHLYFIKAMIHLALKESKEYQTNIEEAKKIDFKVLDFLKTKENILINPFNVGSRLCGSFAELKISVPGAPSYFLVKPSFSFPFVKPPNMIPNVEEGVLKTEFDIKGVQAPKPEAPWIKRCDFGIKFTDEIQLVDNPVLSETEGGESVQQ